MAKIRTKGVSIDTVTLKDALRDTALSVRDKAAEIAEEALVNMINQINQASTNRLSSLDAYGVDVVSRGTQDKPLAGAKVIVENRRTAGSRRRMVVRVVHKGPNGVNLFDILDGGSRPKHARTLTIFPVYEGELIPSDLETADPDVINSQIVAGNVELQHNDAGRVAMAVIRKGRTIAGFKGKNLYQAVANYVEQELLDRAIVNERRRTSVRLKSGDVRITVPKRGLRS